jgi:hypothetical protein
MTELDFSSLVVGKPSDIQIELMVGTPWERLTGLRQVPFLFPEVAVRRVASYSYAGEKIGISFGVDRRDPAFSALGVMARTGLVSHFSSLRSEEARFGFMADLGSSIDKIGTSNGLEDVYLGIMTVPGVAGSDAGMLFHGKFAGMYDSRLAEKLGGEAFPAMNSETGEASSVSYQAFGQLMSPGNLAGTSYAAIFSSGDEQLMAGGGNSSTDYGRYFFSQGVGLAAAGLVGATTKNMLMTGQAYAAGVTVGDAYYQSLWGGGGSVSAERQQIHDQTAQVVAEVVRPDGSKATASGPAGSTAKAGFDQYGNPVAEVTSPAPAAAPAAGAGSTSGSGDTSVNPTAKPEDAPAPVTTGPKKPEDAGMMVDGDGAPEVGNPYVVEMDSYMLVGVPQLATEWAAIGHVSSETGRFIGPSHADFALGLEKSAAFSLEKSNFQSTMGSPEAFASHLKSHAKSALGPLMRGPAIRF